jgi:cytochrome c biogenesis protein
MLPPNEVTLSLTSKATGKVYKKKAKIGQKIAIPEDKGTFILKAYRNAADYRGQNIGEAFIGTLIPKSGAPTFVLVPLRFPSFDKMRKGEVIISVADFKNRYFTGLQVTKDPGVWIVYSGFILMIIGCYVTFFMSHQQLCIEVASEGNTSRVMVAGTASKNKMAIQQKVKKISEKLTDLENRA